jgi:hypothetical protein
MQLKPTKIALALAGILALTLAGCGGGGSSSTTTTTATPTTSLSGVAATGAAFTDATVAVMDSRGQSVGTGTVGADGTFNITLTAGAVAPFILTATRTSADGATESLVSVVPTGTGTTAAATVNISPVTNLIASRLSSSGDPTKLGAELAAGTSTVNATTVAAKVVEVQTILAPILTATGTTGTDPLTGTFAADGTGYDRLLDSIKVTITPASATAANIEIGIKQQLAEGTDPTTIQFTSSTSAASVPAIPPITASTLVEAGTATLIANHLAQLNACFALPVASRVTGTTAASVQATECKNAFFGNDPSTFKSNGNLVAQGKAFSNLFAAGGDGLVFSQGAYEFTRGNGDIVISYKARTAAGSETFDTFALRKDTDLKLKQIGNQYNYPGGVSAYHQYRQFITLSQSAFNYYSTGYNMSVNNVLSAGVTVFDRVEITTPRNTVLVLKPQAGYSSLQLVKGGVTSGTSFVRLNSEYADTANTTDPAIKDTSLFFADRTVFTNTNIANIPAQSVWKFDYFVAGNATSVPDATQYYKTRSRALTIPELKTKGLALLDASDVAFAQTNADSNGKLPIGGQTSLGFNYSVPAGALPPTSVQIFGQYPTAKSFTDSVVINSTARSGVVQCAPASGADLHCVGNVTGGAYVANTLGTGLHLWARDPAGREYANFYALYRL